jgi:endonuclease-3
MNKEKIFNYLDELITNPVCELEFSKDYELLIAVMLSAQTTDKRVNMVTKVLFGKYPTLEELSMANLEDIKTIIKSLGTYSKKASNIIIICNRLLNESAGKVPNNRDFLESLPGVGRKTTNVVLGILYNVPCIAVDTHVARVAVRLGLAKQGDSVYTIEQKLTKKIPKDYMIRIHHQLLLFGRYYCKAVKPECQNCKLYDICKEKRKSI